MSGYTPEVGHRVRVVLEGEVTSRDGDEFGVRSDNNWSNIIKDLVSVERLPDPEPKWQGNDAVVDAEGNVYISRLGLPGETWPWVGVYGGVSDVVPVRPLIPLVRNGKPWGGS